MWSIDTLGALKAEGEKPITSVPAIYIAKYNRFVDNILERMNKILRKSYDPVSVKLQPIDASKKKTNKTKNKIKSNKRKSTNTKKTVARDDADKINNKLISSKVEEKDAIVPKDDKNVTNKVKVENSPALAEVREVQEEQSGVETLKSRVQRDTPKTKEVQKPKAKESTAKPLTGPTKAPSKTKKRKSTNKKSKGKKGSKKSEKSKPRAKGTLYGLSSLRRNGDVAVNIMSDHTTVKTNFKVGPLVLKVEKEVGRGAKKELKSATATTAEMTGKLNLRIDNQGVATLHSIKVLQPKQVRVDSSDNHEKTREFVWERSARIAHVVSHQLMTASRPVFPSARAL